MMKTLLLGAFSLMLVPYATAQIPLPCSTVDLTYESYNQSEAALHYLNGYRFGNTVTFNSGSQLFDDNFRGFVVNQAQINQDFYILPDAIYSMEGTTPPSNPNGEFNIQLCNREQELEGAWFAPINYLPQLYEKIEWGIKLPQEVQSAIDNWIHNVQYGTTLSPALNPFDPEQIDARATVYYVDANNVQHAQPAFGFYYRDYERITAFNNPHNEELNTVNDWHWNELTTEYPFRFRYSADAIAHHVVIIKVTVPSMGSWELVPFDFMSYWGDPKNSLIRTTPNGHYLCTSNNDIFFPVGLNINEATFGCSCIQTGLFTADCEECYEDGFNDVCCGIDVDKTKRHGIPGTTIEEYSLATAAYVKLERVLQQLKNKGGNSFRTFFDPVAFDIEFEKINNYFDRQFQAWEFDRMLDKCHELELKVQLNMLIHYMLSKHSFAETRFDWDNTYQDIPYTNTDQAQVGTNGCCYWNACGYADSPGDFLTNPCAKDNYKKKLRYIIARWGYSNDIMLFELLSEANKIGAGQYRINATGEVFIEDGPYHESPFEFRLLIRDWQVEMATYLKDELKCRQLIGTSYAGKAPRMCSIDNDYDCNDAGEILTCLDENYDNTWESNKIDVIGWNNYYGGGNKFQSIGQAFYNDEGYSCSAPFGFSQTNKPVLFGEHSGYASGCDYTDFVKSLFLFPFTGNASAGMSWDEWGSTERWHWMGITDNVIRNFLLESVDLGSETWLPQSALGDEDVSPIEAIFLRKQTPTSARIIGALHNLTWNFYSQGSGPECSTEPPGEVLHADLLNFTDVNSGSNPIYLPSLGSIERYNIEYYSILTGSLLDTETRYTDADGRLLLESYPILTEIAPMALFKVYHNPVGSGSDAFAPMLDEDMAMKGAPSIDAGSTRPSVISNYFCDQDAVQISIKEQDTRGGVPMQLSIKMYDLLGNLMSTNCSFSNGGMLDVSTLSIGVYFLVIEELRVTVKIAKLK